jgi:hypothetical protein
MKLEDQVCSLDLAKRLKELGVKQESSFYWKKNVSALDFGNALKETGHRNEEGSLVTERENMDKFGKWYLLSMSHEDCTDNGWGFYSAFTVAELGEMLPWDLTVSRNIDKEWHIHFMADGLTEKETYSVMSEKSEVNARAKMLIYLIENDLIKTSAHCWKGGK